MRKLNDLKEIALRHMEAKSLETGERVATISVSDYATVAQFENELSQILRQRPLPFVASSRIQERGEFFADEICGVPVVAIRDDNGRARTYLNICRHRGSRLTQETTGKCEKLVCPFHGWSYGLNGELAEIPDGAHCFPSTSTKGYRLKELRSHESMGMLWIVLDTESKSPFRFDLVTNDLEELGFTPAIAAKEFSCVTNCNWKLSVEAFLEVYHFTHAHAPYLSQLQFPSLSLTDTDGENCRIIVPLRKPEEDQPVLAWSQAMYFIFPATFLLFYDDHVSLLALDPISIDKTRFRIIPLVPSAEGLTNQRVKDRIQFLEVITAQDIAILESIQKGLATNAGGRFTFTRLEHALAKFHQDIRAQLGTS